jgi:hypothetical protein
MAELREVNVNVGTLEMLVMVPANTRMKVARKALKQISSPKTIASTEME